MILKSKFHLIIINSILILCFFLTTNCGIYKPADARKIDPNVNERVKKNIEEGRGFRLMDSFEKSKGTNYEFASSNELWRASLDLIDFELWVVKKIKVAHLNLLPQMQCGELRLIC